MKNSNIFVVCAFGLFVSSITSYFTQSFWAAWITFILIACLMFQVGVGFPTTEPQVQPNPFKPRTFKELFGLIFALGICFCVGYSYKVGLWDNLKPGWTQIGATLAFFLANWLVPYVIGDLSFGKKKLLRKSN